MIGALARLASGGPARVFPLVGAHPPGRVELLRLGNEVTEDVTLVDSPRAATVLLVAGHIPASLQEPARRVHDQLPHPRSTVWWVGASGSESGRESARTPFGAGTDTFPLVLVESGTQADELDALRTLGRTLRKMVQDLVSGVRPSEPDLLPDVDPTPWRGVGPYGQGGAGMTGGVPYGRPMTERAADRDGLELDQLPLRVGPYFPPFPAGLVLDLKLQGDLVQESQLGAAPHTPPARIFATALAEPVPIATLELARARSHLAWLAHALHVHGLAALGRRALQLSSRLGGVSSDARFLPAILASAQGEILTLQRAIECSGLFWWSTRGVGVLTESGLRAHPDALDAGGTHALGLGPVARAAGLRDDCRVDEPAYRALGFEPVVQAAGARSQVGDASARWRQRISEVYQSLDLAARAGDAHAWGNGIVEGVRGTMTAGADPQAALFALIPDAITGRAWEDAVTTVVSLDLGVGGAVQDVHPWAAREQLRARTRRDAAAGDHEMSGMSGMAGM